MGVSRKLLREMREAPWRSVDELKTFVASVVPASRRDVQALMDVLLDPGVDANGPFHKNRCSALKNICLASADPSLFVPLAQSLERADPMLRRAIAGVLPKCNDVEQHGLLCVALGARDPDARAVAGSMLGALAGPSALRELTKLVAGPSFAGRRDALDLMVPKARHRALDLVDAVLRHGNTPDKLHAISLAADRNTMSGGLERAIQVVFGAIDDRDGRVAQAAFKAFAALADEDRFVETLEPRLSESDVSPVLVEALGEVRSARTAGLLSARLRRGPVPVQVAAIRALQKVGGDGAIEGLVDALHQEDPTVRRTASEALTELARSGELDVAKLLLRLLASPMPHVRRTAAQLAPTTRESSDDLTHQLLQALRDEDWWVRERVLDAIVEMGFAALADGLVELLADGSPVIRRYAIYGLLRLKDPATLGAILRTSVSDDDWWVREQAILATAEFQDDRAVPYLEMLIEERPDLRVACLEALVALRAERTLLDLAELTSDESATVRLAMLDALAQLERGREAAFNVQACVHDDEPSVAQAARKLLERWQVASESDDASVGLLDRLLVAASRKGADDLLISPGRPPYVKHHGSVSPISKGTLSPLEMERMLIPILSEAQRNELQQGGDVDLSYDVPGFDLRFRINVFRQLPGLSAVFRRIHQHVPMLDELGLPDVVKGFADFPNGLVLVGGPTGSGKSTTLAALIDYINRHHGRHIVTIEDPIEVVHAQRESLINQREVGTHAPTFAAALRATLRQDPDVILVGELRDRETIEFAVNAAETGHLVFATVHTTSAATSLDRLVHACEASRQPVIRSMVAESLRAVLCQQLLRRANGAEGRVVACEILLNNDAVANLIRKDKAFQLPSVMTTHAEVGMQLMDDHLSRLVRADEVDHEDAMLKALDKAAFAEMLEALRHGQSADRHSVAPRPRVTAAPPPRSGAYDAVGGGEGT